MSGLCCLLKTPVKDKPQDSVINRDKELPEYLRKLLKGWLDKADVKHTYDKSCGDYFQPFIYLWIAFNSYLTHAVDETINDLERDLVYAAAHDEIMNDVFDSYYSGCEEFRETVNELSILLPIFNARDLFKEGIGGWQENITDESRESYKEKIFNHNRVSIKKKRIRFEPRCFQNHGCGEQLIDWSHTLSAIYQIRCNLFHGGKSFLLSRDKDFVRYAYIILWRVWGKSFS